MPWVLPLLLCGYLGFAPPHIYGNRRKDKFSIREKLGMTKRYESYANKIYIRFEEQ